MNEGEQQQLHCTLHGRRRRQRPCPGPLLLSYARPGSAIGRIGVQQTLAARQDDPGSSDPCPHRRERLGLRYVPQSLPFRTGPTAVHDCRTLVANGSGSNLTSFERYRQSGTLRCLSYKTLLLPQLSSAPFGTLLPLSSTLRLLLCSAALLAGELLGPLPLLHNPPALGEAQLSHQPPPSSCQTPCPVRPHACLPACPHSASR